MNTSHKIKQRSAANDKVYTPEKLAKELIDKVPYKYIDHILDPFFGSGVFFNNIKCINKTYTEIDLGLDFFNFHNKVDWIISNPPYSLIDDVLSHSASICDSGFAYLLLGHALTPKRIELMEKKGFGLTTIHLSKVFKWYGISYFCIWEKNKSSIISFDRTIWRD